MSAGPCLIAGRGRNGARAIRFRPIGFIGVAKRPDDFPAVLGRAEGTPLSADGFDQEQAPAGPRPVSAFSSATAGPGRAGQASQTRTRRCRASASSQSETARSHHPGPVIWPSEPRYLHVLATLYAAPSGKSPWPRARGASSAGGRTVPSLVALPGVTVQSCLACQWPCVHTPFPGNQPRRGIRRHGQAASQCRVRRAGLGRSARWQKRRRARMIVMSCVSRPVSAVVRGKLRLGRAGRSRWFSCGSGSHEPVRPGAAR